VNILRALGRPATRWLAVLLGRGLYRLRAVGREHLPATGPGLLVSNHVSLLDPLLLMACAGRPIRQFVRCPSDAESVRNAREALEQGQLVCVFAEGDISRTGNLHPFQPFFEKITAGLSVPVIPTHLDGLWGSLFSACGTRFLFRWPPRLRRRVTMSFGPPLPEPEACAARQAVLELAGAAFCHRRTRRDLLHLRFLRTAKRRWFAFAMADSSGKKLTFGEALVAALLLARWLRRRRPQDRMIGLLLPASVGGGLANAAVLLAGKIPVNLNFTAGAEAVQSAIQQCSIQTILTSKVFLAKAKLDPRPEMIFLEDVLQEVTPMAKLGMAVIALLLPSRLLERFVHPGSRDPDSLGTVVFSSGSTGAPKGIMLSHHNVLSNIEALDQIFWIRPRDCFLGVLPFFHSFGFTCTLWFPLVVGCGVVYHPNPMDAKVVGELAAAYRATFLLATPAFFAAYIRRCTPEQFATLRIALAGAEKLHENLAQEFQRKYGLPLCEGYGCTEMAPVVAANVPQPGTVRQASLKPGTVGHPIPGVTARIVDPASGATLPCGQEGLLLIKGPNSMMGYLGQPEATAAAFREGWYQTGDIACLDEDGFIRITDRLSRFSKIAGEMVPHLRVEEALSTILGEAACLVTAVPDEHKGERLVVLYTRGDISPGELWRRLGESRLPKLWIPKAENFFRIEALPVLGSGKADLRRARELARKLTAGSA